MLLKKWNKNRWMMLCLLFGLILSLAIISSASIYGRAVMQRVLTSDLNEQSETTRLYSGGYDIIKRLSSDLPSEDQDKKFKILGKFDNETTELSKDINIPLLSDKYVLTAEKFVINSDSEARPEMKIEGVSKLGEHIKIIKGRIFSDARNKDGEYEVIASEKAMENLKLAMDRTYSVYLKGDGAVGKPFKIRVVGIYSFKDGTDPYWGEGDWSRPGSVLMDPSLFENSFMGNETMALNQIEWYFAYDSRKITPENLMGIVDTVEKQKMEFTKDFGADTVFFGEDVLKKYMGKAQNIQNTLWVLQAPVLLMLLIYITMMANLIVEQDKNEIAVLKSRGAGRLQIFSMYFIQSCVMSGIAILIGPFIGIYLCKIIGASNGFLQFVQRKAMDVQITPREYIYSFAAAVIFIAAMMAPVINASRTTIVLHKQKRYRYNSNPFWKKYFLDIVFAVLTGYGLYTYTQRQMAVLQLGNAQVIPVDPLLYLISTFFVLAAGLLFLRLYPYIIRFLFWAGKKIWSPSAYASLINVGRSDGKNQFLMIFLILTVSIGIFNVKTAATVNGNIEDTVRYTAGADMVLQGQDRVDDKGMPDIGDNILAEISKLNGVEAATKVFKEEGVRIDLQDYPIYGVSLMGITPDEFGRIAWLKNGLLQYPWQEYLNLLEKEPRAMLLSSSLQKAFNLKPGDAITIEGDNGLSVNGFVGAFVDYWPTYDLNSSSILVVANIQYLEKNSLIWPYEVWVKKSSGNSSALIKKDADKKKLKFEKWTDADQNIVKEKNDPMLQGTNGTLTLGFAATMMITIIGFIIYWLLSIKSRVLQFGVLRAMGLPMKKLIGVLIYEQILISAAAIGAGILIGQAASGIFIPLIQMASNQAQILPFKVISPGRDFIGFYIICGSMLVLGLLILIRFVAKIKIDQAIKLGED